MASIKISDLESVSALSDSDVMPIVNGGDTKKVSIQQLNEQFGGDFAPYVFVENGSNAYNINTTANKNIAAQIMEDIGDGKHPIVYLLSTHIPNKVAADNPIYLYPLIVTEGTAHLEMYCVGQANEMVTNTSYGAYYRPTAYYKITVSTNNGVVSSISMSEITAFLVNSMTNSQLPLATGNTTAFTPTGDYNPATKKYVDDAIASAITTTLGGSA